VPNSDVLVTKMPALAPLAGKVLTAIGVKAVADKVVGSDDKEENTKLQNAKAAAQIAQQQQAMAQQRTQSREDRARSMLNAGIRGDAQKSKDVINMYDNDAMNKAWNELKEKNREILSKKVNAAGNYTKPGMRKRLFNRIKAGSKGGKPGQWSARKAQLLAMRYKKKGGGYRD